MQSQVFTGKQQHLSFTRLRQKQPSKRKQALCSTRCTKSIQTREDASVLDNMPDLYKLAIVAAQHQHMTVIEYLQRVNESASAFVASDEICDRAELKAAMTQAMCSQGQLTLVLGGKSVGKSRVKEFIAREIERSSGSKLTVVDINMRTVPSKPLYNALLERMAEVSPLSIIKVLGNVVAGGTALQLLDEKTTAAVALYATKTASEITQKALDLVSVLPSCSSLHSIPIRTGWSLQGCD